jgi:hypothetical protein
LLTGASTVLAYAPPAASPMPGLDNGEAFGGQLYLRGAFNDWAPRAEWGFINTGDGIYQLEQQFRGRLPVQDRPAGLGRLRPRGAQRGHRTRASRLRSATPVRVGPNGNLVIPSDGCWNITLNATDVANITLLLTPVGGGGGGGGKTVCGVGHQGLDDGEAFGGQLYMRGGFSDWAPRPANAFYNFGEGLYQAEFELAGGDYQYKIAQQAWDQFDRIVLGEDTVPGPVRCHSVDPGPGGPNGNLVVPKDACWNFLIDARDLGNLTLRVSEVDSVRRRGPGPFTGVEIRLLDPQGESISTQRLAWMRRIDQRIQLCEGRQRAADRPDRDREPRRRRRSVRRQLPAGRSTRATPHPPAR